MTDKTSIEQYRSEAALVRDFVDALISGEDLAVLTSPDVAQEFDYRAGRADVVSVSVTGEVVAFEAKLDRWRDALHQAYRNTSFAHRSYVVLPLAVAERAASFSAEFEQRRVGLCAIQHGVVTVLHEAPRHDPVQPWLTQLAIVHARATVRSRAEA